MRGRLTKIAAWLLGIPLGIYAALLVVMYLRQESLIFQPDSLPQDHRFAVSGLDEVQIPVEGATLHARHLKLPNPRGVVFFLHGNGGNVDSWVTGVDFYRRINYDLFILDYRGYGKSSGRISSEAELHADVRRAWDFVAPQYANKIKVIFGRSLGTGLAAKLAADVNPDKAVLVSPYISMRAMVHEVYPFVPGALLRYPLRTDEYLPKINSPVLLIHGDHDELIPVAHTKQLKQLSSLAEAIIITGGRHADLQEIPAYTNGLAERLMALGHKP